MSAKNHSRLLEHLGRPMRTLSSLNARKEVIFGDWRSQDPLLSQKVNDFICFGVNNGTGVLESCEKGVFCQIRDQMSANKTDDNNKSFVIRT